MRPPTLPLRGTLGRCQETHPEEESQPRSVFRRIVPPDMPIQLLSSLWDKGWWFLPQSLRTMAECSDKYLGWGRSFGSWRHHRHQILQRSWRLCRRLCNRQVPLWLSSRRRRSKYIGSVIASSQYCAVNRTDWLTWMMVFIFILRSRETCWCLARGGW